MVVSKVIMFLEIFLGKTAKNYLLTMGMFVTIVQKTKSKRRDLLPEF